MIMETTYVQDYICYNEEDLGQCWINVIMFIVIILSKSYKHPRKFIFQNRLVTRPVKDSMVQGQVISPASSLSSPASFSAFCPHWLCSASPKLQAVSRSRAFAQPFPC